MLSLQKFNANYHYAYDWVKYGTPEWIDIWEVIEPNSEGQYHGDCESYCLTLKEKVYDFEYLELYYCTINSNGHCIGKINNKWIDCNFKELRDTLPDSYKNLVKYNIFIVFYKRLLSKLLMLFLKPKI